LCLDNGFDSNASQTYDLSTDIVQINVSVDGGGYTNTWLGSELFIEDGLDHNFISTDANGTATLDLTIAQFARVVFSNAQGTWQFGVTANDSGYNPSWLSIGPAFSPGFAYHSIDTDILLSSIAIPEPHGDAYFGLLAILLLPSLHRRLD
jgi:hypothetical protein